MWTPGICMVMVVPVLTACVPSAPMEAGMRSAVFADGVLDECAALVTGGGTGLGRAAAIELAACGASVVIAGRREEVLAAAVEQIGPRASYVAGDVRERFDAE